MKRYLVTGALGFIGSNFVNYLLETSPTLERVVVLDKKDYCSSLKSVANDPRVEIVIGNIGNSSLVSYLLNSFKIDTVVHFAASTHVDNSFLNSVSFSENNIVGTHILLECCRIYQKETQRIEKFLHISTDEVYGEVMDGDMKHENSLLDPTNPYAASKAGAEFMVKSYLYSYKLPIVITRGNNVYGPQQFPEKLIPKFICLLLDEKPLTIHGNGGTKRNFIHVRDVASAVHTVLSHGKIGETYNISSSHDNEYTVLEIAKMVVELFYGPDEPLEKHLSYVEDRQFNDYRYCISSEKLHQLGWKPLKTDVKGNIMELIEWYRRHVEEYFPDFRDHI
jgi:dTDP-glucose 4,6-dehydratase